MTVFWSWQSDLQGKTNRHFVKDAIEQALNELSEDQSLEEAHRDELIIDQDSKGVPGTPDLATIILQKIDKCSVFIADVSIVGQLMNEKSVINSNVAVELGYAMKAKGGDRILMVANEAFTARDGLPFDLRHKRGPIFFNLSDDATKSNMLEEKLKLVSKLKEAIRLVLVANPSQVSVSTHSAVPANENGMYFKTGDVLLKRDGQPNPWTVSAVQTKFFSIRVIPTKSYPALKRVNAKEMASSAGTMHKNSGFYNEQNDWGAISVAATSQDNSLMAATQIFLNREIWGLDCYYVNVHSKEGEYYGVPTGVHEQMFLDSVNKYFELARKKLDVSLPIEIELGMVGGKGNYLFMGNNFWEKYWGPIHDDRVTLHKTMRTDELAEREALCLEFFEKLFDSAGHSRPENYNNFPVKK